MGSKAREISGIESLDSDNSHGSHETGKLSASLSSSSSLKAGSSTSSHGPQQNGKQPATQVSVDYPTPTPLSTIIKDVAQWSGKVFVMEPTSNVKLQIFASTPLSKQQAWLTFLASLSVINLRAVETDQVVKIVPIIKQVGA